MSIQIRNGNGRREFVKVFVELRPFKWLQVKAWHYPQGSRYAIWFLFLVIRIRVPAPINIVL